MKWPFVGDGLTTPATKAALGFRLPADLRAFYLFSDGFNGELTVGRGETYLRLHSVREALAFSQAYDSAKGAWLLGDNGGDQAFALRIDGAHALYFHAGLIGDWARDAVVIAYDFPSFLMWRAR